MSDTTLTSKTHLAAELRRLAAHYEGHVGQVLREAADLADLRAADEPRAVAPDHLRCTCMTVGNSAQIAKADPACPRHAEPPDAALVSELKNWVRMYGDHVPGCPKRPCECGYREAWDRCNALTKNADEASAASASAILDALSTWPAGETSAPKAKDFTHDERCPCFSCRAGRNQR
jgi:hypothetical protein